MNNKEVKMDLKNIKEVFEYKTGYKNPPKHTQFKKGQSGNPAGRKKKIMPKSLFEAIIMELCKTKTIKTKNGAYQKFAHFELLAMKMLQDAMQKDGNTRKLIFCEFFKTDVLAMNKYLEELPQKNEEMERKSQEVANEIIRKLDAMISEGYECI